MKASLLVFHMVAGAVAFAGPAMPVRRSGWESGSVVEGCRHYIDGCSYDYCIEGGLEAELPDPTLGHSTGWGLKWKPGSGSHGLGSHL